MADADHEMDQFQANGDDQQYEEMDLTPYEEDDDSTLHKKLVAAKMARKRAEEDLKLLCNRIGLLKQEEGKVTFVFFILLGGTQNRRDQETGHRHLHTKKT